MPAANLRISDEPLDTRDSQTAHLWGRWETSFRSSRHYEHPVLDVDVWANLTSPSGTPQRAAAFWDGDDIWRVRFCPTEIGHWTYTTESSDVKNEGLHRGAGAFACVPYEGDNLLFRKGQIRVAESGHHFAYADGTPFFLLADTCWNGPHLSNAEEWERYLNDRAVKRFSAVLFTAPHFRGLAANADGRKAFAGRDRIEIDPLFFQRLDDRIDAMNDHGFLAVPLLLHAGEDTDLNTGFHLPADQAIALSKYLIARYDAHHVLWDFVAEAFFHGSGARYWKGVGGEVFASSSRHPVTLHPHGLDWALDSFIDEPWMDVVGYQSAHGDNEASLRWIPEGPPAHSWSWRPARPFINLEPPYEGHLANHSRTPFDAATVRRHTYWSLFASPIAGVAYGGHGVWGWDDGSGAPFAHESTGPAPAWYDALNLPGSVSMQKISELLSSFDWWDFYPAPSLIAEQPGADDPRLTVIASGTLDGKIGLIYTPRGSQAIVAVPPGPGTPRAAWVDPRTGNRTPIAVPSGVATWSPVAPDGEDWVLLIQG